MATIYRRQGFKYCSLAESAVPCFGVTGILLQGASSPTYQDMIEPVEDKTHIVENLDNEDLSPRSHGRGEAEDDALMPVEGLATATSVEGKDQEAEVGGKPSVEARVSDVDLQGEDRREPTRDSTDVRLSSGGSDAPPVSSSKQSADCNVSGISLMLMSLCLADKHNW